MKTEQVVSGADAYLAPAELREGADVWNRVWRRELGGKREEFFKAVFAAMEDDGL